MTALDDLRKRIVARPSPEQLACRQRAIAAIRSLQVVIAPMTVTELRRIAREEETTDGGSRGEAH